MRQGETGDRIGRMARFRKLMVLTIYFNVAAAATVWLAMTAAQLIVAALR